MTANPRERLALEPELGGNPEIGRLLWMLEDCRRRTKETLEGLPEGALDWEPTQGENSIGTILYHLAAIEADWLYVEVLQTTDFPPEVVALFPQDVRDDTGRLAVVAETTLAAHVERLDAVRENILDAYRAMTLADFRRVRHLPDYDVTPEYVLHHLMQHEAEHRGQMGLLRVMFEAGAGSGN